MEAGEWCVKKKLSLSPPPLTLEQWLHSFSMEGHAINRISTTPQGQTRVDRSLSQFHRSDTYQFGTITILAVGLNTSSGKRKKKIFGDYFE